MTAQADCMGNGKVAEKEVPVKHCQASLHLGWQLGDIDRSNSLPVEYSPQAPKSGSILQREGEHKQFPQGRSGPSLNAPHLKALGKELTEAGSAPC